MPPTNDFKTALASSRAQYGLVLGTSDALALEIIAGAGFDGLLLDAEHSPRSLEELPIRLALIRAAGASVHLAVRPRADAHAAQLGWLFDLGVQTLVAPQVECAAQAEALAVAMCAAWGPRSRVRRAGAAMLSSCAMRPIRVIVRRRPSLPDAQAAGSI